jgi:glucan phosphoethanolaminetransferase (alkaline phosphatase superfamily)
MKKNTKSPLKDRPLRYVGQSTDEAIDNLLNDKVLLSFVLIIVLVISVILEWMRYFTPATHPPVLITIIFALTSAFYIYKIFKQLRKFKRLKLGREGKSCGAVP